MAGSPSMKDVAAHARVSLGTVSNVLNRPEVVAERTRQRVLAAIAELGFVRNESARQLRGGGSRTLAYVVLDTGNPFFTDVAQGVQDAADAAGLAVFLCDSGQDRARQSAYLDLLEQQRVEGVLITPVDRADQRLALLPRRGTPVVMVDAHSPDHCSVFVDDVAGGDLAATHLHDGGHRHIAFVGGPASLPQVRRPARRGAPGVRPQRPRRRATSWCSRPRRSTSPRAVARAPASRACPPAVVRRPRSAPTTCSRSGCCRRRCGWACACPRTSRSSATTTSCSPRPPPCR